MDRDHRRGRLDDKDANEGAWEAARGGVTGAAWWGLYGAAVAGAGYYFSPVYRGLTVQFKVFIQMSFMTMGSMIHADERLRLHEARVRRATRLAKDAEVWRRFEEQFEESGTPGVGGEGRVSRKDS